MDAIVIIGSSGHAKVVIDIVEQEGRYRIAGLVDPRRQAGEQTLGYPVLGSGDDLPVIVNTHAVLGAIVAIGDNFVRAGAVASIAETCPGLPLVTAVHPRAAVSAHATIGDGTVVMAGAVVGPAASVGRCCIINTNASLDHDSSMGEFASLAPGAVTGGDCAIGKFSAIGLGAKLVHGVEVGGHSVVGAAALVNEDLGTNVVAYGVPARVIRTREQGDRYL